MNRPGVSVLVVRKGGQFIADCAGHSAIDRSAKRAAQAAASAFLGIDGRRIEVMPLQNGWHIATVKPARAATDSLLWLIIGCTLVGALAVRSLWRGGDR